MRGTASPPNNKGIPKQGGPSSFDRQNIAHPGTNDAYNVRIVSGSFQIWGCLFAAARFGKLYAHLFILRINRDYNNRVIVVTIEQMINRAQRVHQFVME